MTLGAFLVLLLVAGVCGAVGQAIAGYSRGGCLASIGLGLVGALLGTYLSRALGLPELFALQVGGTSLPIVWTIAGAALIVLIVSLVSRGKRV